MPPAPSTSRSATAKPKGRAGAATASDQQKREEFEKQHPRAAKGRVGAGKWIVKGAGTGDEGPDAEVRQLQNRLTYLGYPAESDGQFGSKTEGAVKRFQGDHGLERDGRVGEKTTEALRKATPQDAPPPDTSGAPAEEKGYGDKYRGAAGADARAKQNKDLTGDESLDKKGKGGGKGSSKGKGGSASKSRGRASGEIAKGRDLISKGAGMTTAKGDPAVKQIQQLLDSLGFDLGSGGTDGRFGPDTERALKAFQRRYGLKADGLIAKRTRRALNIVSKVMSNRERKKPGASLETDVSAEDLKKALGEAVAELEAVRETGGAEARARARVASAIEEAERVLEANVRGSARRAIRRLDDGTFAPAGMGRVLTPSNGDAWRRALPPRGSMPLEKKGAWRLPNGARVTPQALEKLRNLPASEIPDELLDAAISDADAHLAGAQFTRSGQMSAPAELYGRYLKTEQDATKRLADLRDEKAKRGLPAVDPVKPLTKQDWEDYAGTAQIPDSLPDQPGGRAAAVFAATAGDVQRRSEQFRKHAAELGADGSYTPDADATIADAEKAKKSPMQQRVRRAAERTSTKSPHTMTGMDRLALVKAAKPLKHKTTLYHGSNSGDYLGGNVGDVVTIPSAVSFTGSPGVADQYGGGKGGVEYHFEAPAGTRTFRPADYTGAFRGEDEHTLLKNTRVRIDGREQRNDGTIVVYGTILPGGGSKVREAWAVEADLRRWLLEALRDRGASDPREALEEAIREADSRHDMPMTGGGPKPGMKCPACGKDADEAKDCKRKKGCPYKAEEASVRGGSRVAIRRLDDGTFAPAGTGRVLEPGMRVTVPHKSGKGTVRGRVVAAGKNRATVKLDDGPDKGVEFKVARKPVSRGDRTEDMTGPQPKRSPGVRQSGGRHRDDGSLDALVGTGQAQPGSKYAKWLESQGGKIKPKPPQSPGAKSEADAEAERKAKRDRKKREKKMRAKGDRAKRRAEAGMRDRFAAFAMAQGKPIDAVEALMVLALEEVKSSAYPGLDRSPKKNWVDKAGGLPTYIERVAKHLHYEKDRPIGTAIAIAVNVVKKMCASGDLNFPGVQQVNAGSRAEACKAVAEWEAKKAKAHAQEGAAEAFRVALAATDRTPTTVLGSGTDLAEAAGAVVRDDLDELPLKVFKLAEEAA